jgi:hypothetical protein
MKNLTLLLFFFILSTVAFSQSKSVEALYQKHKSNPDFFHMDLGGNFMDFAKGMNIELDEEKTFDLANSLEKIKFFKLPIDSQSANAEFRMLQKSLEREKFDLMLEMSEKQSGVVVYTKGNSRINDIVVLINDKSGDFLVVELQGNFDSKAVAEAGKSIR